MDCLVAYIFWRLILSNKFRFVVLVANIGHEFSNNFLIDCGLIHAGLLNNFCAML